MSRWLRGLSFRTEFAIVIVGAFGLPLAGAISVLLQPEKHGPHITNAGLLVGSIADAVVGLLLWQFLRLRGWTTAQAGLSPGTWWSQEFLTTPLAVLALVLLFAIATFESARLVLRVWPNLFLSSPGRLTLAPDLRMTNIAVGCLINALYEEVFVCAYVVSSLSARIGVARAVSVSTAIRVSYHLYKGVAIAVLTVVPIGVMFAIWFARTKRLSPLILAHATIDFVLFAGLLRAL
jgi:uncharacterized protein